MSLPEVTLIGTGALGNACLRAFVRFEIPVKSIYNRTASPRTERLLSAGMPFSGSFPESADSLGSLVFLTVSDSAIAPVVRRLTEIAGEWKGRHVVHCSGSLSSDVLEPLGRKGAGIASFHPLQTFTERSGPESFDGIRFSTEGMPEPVEVLKRVARKMEASLFPAEPESRPWIHLAAVFSANYQFALMEAARKTGEEGALPGDTLLEALQPLVNQTLQNIGSEGLEQALSGPIARGDAGTVRRHLELMKNQPALKSLYMALGREVLGIVRRRGERDEETLETIGNLLGDVQARPGS